MPKRKDLMNPLKCAKCFSDLLKKLHSDSFFFNNNNIPQCLQTCFKTFMKMKELGGTYGMSKLFFSKNRL